MATASTSDPVMKSQASGSGSETSESATVVVGKGSNYQQLLMVKYRGLKKWRKERGFTAKERISKMPPCAAGKHSSIYRGVTIVLIHVFVQCLNGDTRHRWTSRYEAHLWDKSTWNQNKKEKQGQILSVCACVRKRRKNSLLSSL